MTAAAKTIGANLHAARTGAGLTMRALAGQVGVSPSAIHYWETAVRGIPAVKLVALAGALGVSVGRLLGLEPGEVTSAIALRRGGESAEQAFGVRADAGVGR